MKQLLIRSIAGSNQNPRERIRKHKVMQLQNFKRNYGPNDIPAPLRSDMHPAGLGMDIDVHAVKDKAGDTRVLVGLP